MDNMIRDSFTKPLQGFMFRKSGFFKDKQSRIYVLTPTYASKTQECIRNLIYIWLISPRFLWVER